MISFLSGWTDDITGVSQIKQDMNGCQSGSGLQEDWGKFQAPQLLAVFSEDGVGIEYVYARTQDESCATHAHHDGQRKMPTR